MQVDDVSVSTVGAKYVSGDITFAVNHVDGSADDMLIGTSEDSANDAYEATSASVSYAVVSGVTAIIGYTTTASNDEASADTSNSGQSWNVGANVSF